MHPPAPYLYIFNQNVSLFSRAREKLLFMVTLFYVIFMERSLFQNNTYFTKHSSRFIMTRARHQVLSQKKLPLTSNLFLN